jgi:hypothetical protein
MPDASGIAVRDMMMTDSEGPHNVPLNLRMAVEAFAVIRVESGHVCNGHRSSSRGACREGKPI